MCHQPGLLNPMSAALQAQRHYLVIQLHINNLADHWWHIAVDVGNMEDLVCFHFVLFGVLGYGNKALQL